MNGLPRALLLLLLAGAFLCGYVQHWVALYQQAVAAHEFDASSPPPPACATTAASSASSVSSWATWLLPSFLVGSTEEENQARCKAWYVRHREWGPVVPNAAEALVSFVDQRLLLPFGVDMARLLRRCMEQLTVTDAESESTGLPGVLVRLAQHAALWLWMLLLAPVLLIALVVALVAVILRCSRNRSSSSDERREREQLLYNVIVDGMQKQPKPLYITEETGASRRDVGYKLSDKVD
jgi:hypothetical protein